MTSGFRGHVLGIESSCDDTGIAIVDQDGKILSNCIHSQLRDTISFGGVIPVVAKEIHLLNIDTVAQRAWKESGLKSIAQDISAIAVTTRPGLDFSLKVGLHYARTLAKKYQKPLIPIHHMQAHALMPLLQNRSIRFPFLTLLISGGHCLLAIAKSYNDYHILGQSLDDAPGDLLDKVARRMRLKNLGDPFDKMSGGAAIELLAKREGAEKFKHFNHQSAIPMNRLRTCDFSFSGYRGSFEQILPMVDDVWLTGNRDSILKEFSDVCASLQRVILIQLVRKLHRAILYFKMHWSYKNEDAFAEKSGKDHLGFARRALKDINDPSAVDIVISGGVAANQYFVDGIRSTISHMLETEARVFAPSKSLCSDNGLMIAWNGLLRYRNYLENGPYSVGDTDNSVLHQLSQIESIQTHPQAPIGLDLSCDVRAKNFQFRTLKHPELKVKSAAATNDNPSVQI